ncbi:hypothetical protein T07_12415 [Trichinella nelsoni]|uniref:Uncharacterized protein n=1 Tax=Trichinella nelsoni TaxID=6336 RepID=A0A0V0RU17_9BILA|nr:hypothetical protein T07_12415 [Trichinella nelsoni]
MDTVHFSLVGKKNCRVWAKSVQLLWNNGLLNEPLVLGYFENCASRNDGNNVIQASLDKLNSEVPVPFNHTADDNSLSIENA